MKKEKQSADEPTTEPKEVAPLGFPGKPGKPFQPGVDPVPVPWRVEQHPLYSTPQAAKPI